MFTRSFPSAVARIAALLVACTAAVAAAGCGVRPQSAAHDERTVVATSSLVADLVRRVGGSRVEVVSLLPPGADPHHYEPLPSDARAVAEASVLFRSGGDLDAWLEDVLAASGSEAPTVALLDAVSEAKRTEAGAEEHWWHDPEQTMVAVRAIAATLAAADAEGAGSYRRNARVYVATLRRLDREIARCLSRVPAENRELVTTHEALDAFARAYDLRPVGVLIPEGSIDAQPSAGEIAELVARIRERDVPAIFPASPSHALEQAVAGEADTAVGGELWADGLGPAGSDGATYVEAMASNTADLIAGLTRGSRTCRPAARSER